MNNYLDHNDSIYFDKIVIESGLFYFFIEKDKIFIENKFAN